MPKEVLAFHAGGEGTNLSLYKPQELAAQLVSLQ
jgi:hypothetical protein